MSSTTDTNFDSYVEKDGLILLRDTWAPPINGGSYDDVLKFSNCRNVIVSCLTIPGGREDCIDIVRGENYTLGGLKLQPKKNGVEIKGSVCGWSFDDTEFENHGIDYDIRVGMFDNYWKPGRKPTRNGLLRRVRMKDGSKVRVFLWDAEAPEVVDSNVTLYRIPWVVWFPYFLARFVYVRILGLKTK